jgi:GNAT superfamily N-acetyltransferase
MIPVEKVKLSGYIPGAIGKITELHGVYYSRHWGFDLFFEAKVATELSEFLNRFNPAYDGFWVATLGGEIIGSIAIDGMKAREHGAHLRWFIVAQKYQERGIGNILLEEAMGFCRRAGFTRVYLWTFAGLDPARHLYEKHGFWLVEEREGDQWGIRVTEMKLECLF